MNFIDDEYTIVDPSQPVREGLDYIYCKPNWPCPVCKQPMKLHPVSTWEGEYKEDIELNEGCDSKLYRIDQ